MAARIAWPASAVGAVELDVQLAEAAQHVGGVVLVASGLGRAVMLLGDADVGHPLEEADDRRVRLGACERCARTAVDPVPEREVVTTVGAVEPEFVGRVELPRVAT